MSLDRQAERKVTLDEGFTSKPAEDRFAAPTQRRTGGEKDGAGVGLYVAVVGCDVGTGEGFDVRT